MSITPNLLSELRSLNAHPSDASAHGGVLQPIANTDWLEYGVSNGTNTSFTSRKRFLAIASGRGIVLTYANSYRNEISGANDLTISAGFETPDGVIHPVFIGGAREVTIKPGCIVEFDPIPTGVKAGEYFYVRTRGVVASGNVWPVCDFEHGKTVAAFGEGVELDGTDKTLSGTITVSSSAGYYPVCISATTDRVGIAAFGDSICAGFGDSTGVSKPVEGCGLVRRAGKLLGMGVVGVANSGGVASDSMLVRASVARRAKYVVSNYGINHVTAAFTVAQLQSENIAFARKVARNGQHLIWCTLCPIASSTDLCATVENQVAHTNAAARVGLNQWLRDGAPINASFVPQAVGSTGIRAGQAGHPMSSICDIASVLESAQDSSLWLPNYAYLGDSGGTWFKHPNAAGASAAAAKLAQHITALS